MKRPNPRGRPSGQFPWSTSRAINAAKVNTPFLAGLRDPYSHSRKRNGKLCAPSTLGPGRSSHPLTVPIKILFPSGPIAPQCEIQDRIQRIDLNLKVSLTISNRVEKDLDHFFLPERSIALCDGGPRVNIFTVDQHPEFQWRPSTTHLRALLGRRRRNRFQKWRTNNGAPWL